jgi:uncharacterized membrane-anchored protein
MKKLILGNSQTSTIVGYLIAGLQLFQLYYKPEVKWTEWLVPLLIAILGRIVSDSLSSSDEKIGGGGIKNPPKP